MGPLTVPGVTVTVGRADGAGDFDDSRAPSPRYPMILLIDNHDSFTWNLAQLFGALGAEARVFRNDSITVEAAAALDPSLLVISPGPGTPEAAGVSRDMIRRFAGDIPVLGVCLGHQCIAEVFGGRVVRAARLMHGKTSAVHHDGRTIFRGLESPFEAMRYHSLTVDAGGLPASLEVSARTAEGEIMGLRRTGAGAPLEGVQFHPESILTAEGAALIRNFLDLAGTPPATRDQTGGTLPPWR
jgi:para-aminobenzoate synthetase component 2